jgi:enamine deaminase RidA (YjgF/YER057c/UK114 family)
MTTRNLVVPATMKNIYAEKQYSPAVQVGNLVFVSGMLGRDENLNIIAEPHAQFVQLFENLGTVFKSAGTSFDHVVELVGYFTDLQRDFHIYQAVRDRYIRDDFPAQTVIGIKELSSPGLLLELKCVAVIPD